MTSPPVGFFTSAVFTHHALQWLWNYTVEFHPPRWWLAGRWHAVKPQQLVYAPLAWRPYKSARPPRGRAFQHTFKEVTASPLDAVQKRRTARRSYLSRVSQVVYTALASDDSAPDVPTMYRILDLVDSCMYTVTSHEEHTQLRRFVGERLWPYRASETMAIELLALRGDTSAALTQLDALLAHHAPQMRALQSQSLRGQHTRQRQKDPVVDDLYRAASAVLSSLETACIHAKAAAAPYEDTIATHFATWLWTHPRLLAMAQPPFPRVVKAVYTLLSSVSDARAQLERIASLPCSADARSHLASVLCLAFANRGAAQQSAQLMADVLAHGLVPHEGAMRRVLRTAAPLRERNVVQPLVEWLVVHGTSTASFRWLATYYAELGDAESMERMLKHEPEDVVRDRARLICAASRGDVAAVRSYTGPGAPRTEEHAFWLLRALVRHNDVCGARDVFWEATQRFASERLYGEMARMTARLGRTADALDVAAQLQGAGMACSVSTLTYLVQALGHACLPERAAALIAWQRAQGMRPPLRVYTALMTAYIRAGHYVAAQGIFAWLEKQPEAALRPNTSAYNTLLKACVHKGTPVKYIVPFLLDMRRRGLVPDARTYALVMQSACDSGRVLLAEHLFQLADDTLTGGATLALHTILLHAYLRHNNHERARAMIDQLEHRGIQPSHITHAILVHSYAHGTESHLAMAHQLVMRLLDEPQERTWEVPVLEQGMRWHHLLVPLIDAHGKRGDVWEAERLFRRLVDSGEPLSPQALTVLMNAYRAVGDVNQVLRLWDELYATLVMRAASDAAAADMLAGQATGTPSIGPFQRNMLCIPLSLAIDTASRAGRHERVAEIWTRAKRDGLSFDVHNYNHLCRALVRADRLGDALRIVEQVLPDAPPKSQQTVVTDDEAVRLYAADPLYQFASVDDGRTPGPTDPPNRRMDRAMPVAQMDEPARDMVHHANLRAPRDSWFASLRTMRAIHEALEKQRHLRDALLAAFPRAAQRLEACRPYWEALPSV